MLKKHAQFFKSLFIISDLIILAFAWILSYEIRFYIAPIKPPLLGIPSFSVYIQFLLFLWVIWGLVSSWTNLYQPRRSEALFRETLEIAKSLTFTFVLLVAVIYLLRRFEFSRLALIYFWILSMVGLSASRFVVRRTLRALRRRGYNQRFALIAGTGKLGQEILEKIEICSELGIQVVGFLTGQGEETGKRIKGIPILGVYENLDEILRKEKADIFFVALPIDEYGHLPLLLRKLQSYPLDIKVLPGTYEFISLRGGVDELDGLPIVSLQGSPLHGWNKVFKRVFDVTIGTFMLTTLSPLLVTISLLIKMGSKGPILYRQERIGMDGDSFQILKFRTMGADAEKEIGPVWAQENDPRRTKIGTVLRKTAWMSFPNCSTCSRER
jgi:hypothetical protein